MTGATTEILLQAAEFGALFGGYVLMWLLIVILLILFWWWLGSIAFRTNRRAAGLENLTKAVRDLMEQTRLNTSALMDVLDHVPRQDREQRPAQDVPGERREPLAQAPDPAPQQAAPAWIPSDPSAKKQDTPTPDHEKESQELERFRGDIQWVKQNWVLVSLVGGLIVAVAALLFVI